MSHRISIVVSLIMAIASKMAFPPSLFITGNKKRILGDGKKILADEKTGAIDPKRYFTGGKRAALKFFWGYMN